MVRGHPAGGHKLALVFNDHKKQSRASLPGCSRCRSLLRIALSGDDGEHWERVATVEDEVDHSLRIHYPTLTQRGCELLVAGYRSTLTPPQGSASSTRHCLIGASHPTNVRTVYTACIVPK